VKRRQHSIPAPPLLVIVIVRHEVQLLINHNYNKIRKEYDSGLNNLTGLYIQLLSYMPEKKAIQVQLARA